MRVGLMARIMAVLAVVSAVSVSRSQSAPCTTAAEETVGSGRAFHVVVIGDSIEWGDGLRETQEGAPTGKLSGIVARWIATDLNRTVQRTVFAHSGATIMTRASTTKPSDTWPGAVNSAYPLIPDQLKCLPVEQRTAVNLVLIDGCINDVDALGIVNPAHGSKWVSDKVNLFCADVVKTLLFAAARMYPNAIILVTGYYPIISEASDVGPFLDFLRQFFPHDPALIDFRENRKRRKYTDAHDSKRLIEARDSSAENSELFYSLTNKLLAQDVQSVNTQLGTTRVIFVRLPFAPENAYGAKDTLLWPIPGTTIADGVLVFDEEYAERWGPCWDAYFPDLSGLAICQVDATAHPNAKGAKLYADEIIQVLQAIKGRL